MFLWEKLDNSWYGIYGNNVLKFSTSTVNNDVAEDNNNNNKLNSFPFQKSKNGSNMFLDLTTTLKKLYQVFRMIL